MTTLLTIYRLLRRHMGRVEALRCLKRWAQELC